MTSIKQEIRHAAQSQAQKLLDHVNGVMAVVVATADGFDVASAVTQNIDPVRVAALASSISAIGAVVSQEARLGRSRSVTVNTVSGFALMSAVERSDVSLVVNVIANENAILGQVLYQAAECVRALETV